MALDVVDQLVRSSAVDVVVVDSVAGTKRGCVREVSVCVFVGVEVGVCVCLCVCSRFFGCILCAILQSMFISAEYDVFTQTKHTLHLQYLLN